MQDFIRQLAQAYQRIVKTLPESDSRFNDFRKYRDQLQLAQGLLEKSRLKKEYSRLPHQLAVIGPTQSGKSTLLNLLVGDNTAQVSPLAGFTSHAHGYTSAAIDDGLSEFLHHYFSGYDVKPVETLHRHENLDSYSLTKIETDGPFRITDTVLWDTPDFDSISADGYAKSLMLTMGLADTLIMITSRDKYADQSVWEMIQLLQPLKQPKLVVINKLAPDERDSIRDSFEKQWKQSLSSQPVNTILLDYVADTTTDWPSKSDQSRLNEALAALQTKSSEKESINSISGYLQQCWPQWTAPLRTEISEIRQWNRLIDDVIDECLQRYQRDFLNHPQHYETFQRALLQLMDLLEIPALAKPLGYTRRIVSWPVNKLKQAWNQQRYPDQSDEARQSLEVKILHQQVQHLLTVITERAIHESHQPKPTAQWWKQIAERLKNDRSLMEKSFTERVKAYRDAFQPEIEASANRLYRKLEQEPRLLNSLRATRATGDLGAVIIALKTGGIGVQDLILTPAMLSVSSLLAETAMGKAMSHETRHLKKIQFEKVTDELFGPTFKQQLINVPTELAQEERFNISQPQLEEADHWFEKHHG